MNGDLPEEFRNAYGRKSLAEVLAESVTPWESATAFASKVEQMSAALPTRDARAFFLIYLSGLILKQAIEEGKVTGMTGDDRVVESGFLRQEVDMAVKLLDSFAVSEKLQAWIDGRRTQYVDVLKRQRPYSKLRRQWVLASQAGRLSLLEDLMDIQRIVYGAHAMPFEKTEVFWSKELPSSYAGQTISSFKLGPLSAKEGNLSLDLRGIALEKILFNPRYLAGMSHLEAALQTAHHEQIHALITQMGDAALDGRMQKDHFLYEDSLNLTHKKFTTWACAGAVRLNDLYMSDTEEKLCRRQQAVFYGAYAANDFVDRYVMGG